MPKPRLMMLAALLPLAACATPERAATVQVPLAPSPLPALAVGDQISWSSGSTETVVAIDGETVRWRDQDGNTFTSYRNFILPSLEWSYPDNKASTAMDVASDTLWPLKVGNRAHFTAVQTRTAFASTNTYRMEWECGVDATERVQIALGTFDTFRLRCSRYWQGSNVGEIVWSYAPELGRVIRRTWTGAEAADELVAMGKGQLDAHALRVAAKVRQKALDKAESHMRARGGSKEVTVTVVPTATFATSSGGYCREFLQKVTTGKAHATTAGTACRDASGTWTAVGGMKETTD